MIARIGLLFRQADIGFCHHGERSDFPCALYDENDPEMTTEENNERKNAHILRIRQWISVRRRRPVSMKKWDALQCIIVDTIKSNYQH